MKCFSSESFLIIGLGNDYNICNICHQTFTLVVEVAKLLHPGSRCVIVVILFFPYLHNHPCCACHWLAPVCAGKVKG